MPTRRSWPPLYRKAGVTRPFLGHAAFVCAVYAGRRRHESRYARPRGPFCILRLTVLGGRTPCCMQQPTAARGTTESSWCCRNSGHSLCCAAGGPRSPPPVTARRTPPLGPAGRHAGRHKIGTGPDAQPAPLAENHRTSRRAPNGRALSETTARPRGRGATYAGRAPTQGTTRRCANGGQAEAPRAPKAEPIC